MCLVFGIYKIYFSFFPERILKCIDKSNMCKHRIYIILNWKLKLNWKSSQKVLSAHSAHTHTHWWLFWICSHAFNWNSQMMNWNVEKIMVVLLNARLTTLLVWTRIAVCNKCSMHKIERRRRFAVGSGVYEHDKIDKLNIKWTHVE